MEGYPGEWSGIAIPEMFPGSNYNWRKESERDDVLLYVMLTYVILVV